MLLPGGSYSVNKHFGWTGAVTDNSGVAKPDDPSQPVALYWAQLQRWIPVADVLGGTEVMRSKADKYLPRLPREDDQCWNTRISRSVLSPFLHRLILAAVGLILRKPIQLEDASDYWLAFSENVDREGTSLHDFAAKMLYSSLAYGHHGLLVDFPASDARTLAEEVQMQARPYLIQVPCFDTIGWRQNVQENGGQLQQLRLREYTTEDDGRFGSKLIQQIRVLEPGRWEVWRESSGANGWELYDKGTTSLKAIPYAACYSNREAVLVSRPPLAEIAQLNIQHYSLQAQLLHCLAVAAHPMLVMAGWDSNDDTVPNMTVSNAIATGPRGESEIYYVEPATQSFQATQEELSNLEEQMANLGVTILARQKNAAESGLSKQLDRADSNSMLARLSQELEQTLQMAVDWAAEYSGQEAPTVVIDRDFDHERFQGDMITSLTNLYTNGLLDRETTLRLLQYGEVIPPEFDIEEIMSASEAEELQGMEMDLQKQEAQMELSAEYEQPSPEKPKPFEK
jgi:hypothetical protein